jgi:4-hydroxybenzoate polyprenyltransferase
MSIIQEYAKLGRVHSAVLSGLTPVLGALSVGILEFETLIILFLIGFCTHIYGFAFNEYMDVDLDRKSKLLSDKPLVKGTISKHAAIAYALSGVIFGYILTMVLIITQQSNPMVVILLYSLSWVSIGVYDLASKSVRYSDLALAFWTGSLCLFGGYAVSKQPGPLLFIIAGLAFFQLYIQNILAGLKDIPQDKAGSGTTTPLRFGVSHHLNYLVVPLRFQTYIYGLKFVHLFIVFIPFIFSWLTVSILKIFVIFLFLLIDYLLVVYMFNSPVFNRNKLLRAIGLHEILSYSIVPIMIIEIIGFEGAVFLIVLPIVWLALSMRAIYGRLLPAI